MDKKTATTGGSSTWQARCRSCGAYLHGHDDMKCMASVISANVEEIRVNTRDAKWLSFLQFAVVTGFVAAMLSLVVWP